VEGSRGEGDEFPSREGRWKLEVSMSELLSERLQKIFKLFFPFKHNMKQRIRPNGRIVIDPKIMVGKPVIKGTRIPVEMILKKLAQNIDVDEILRDYPRITKEDIKAAIQYAESLVEDTEVYPLLSPSHEKDKVLH
jgi:uncharacterized protein (DUF433 family)